MSLSEHPGNAAIRSARGGPVKREEWPREAHDHYVEERWVSKRLLEEMIAVHRPYQPPTILDPAAGFGHVIESARELGLTAIGTDLVQRAPGMRGGRDFLSPAYRPPKGDPLWIVSNPPFAGDLIERFARKALGMAERVALLTPTRRLNAAGVWLETLPLTRVFYVTPRPSMWPGPIYAAKATAGERLGAGTEDVCWLVFGGDTGEGRIGWLKRDR